MDIKMKRFLGVTFLLAALSFAFVSHTKAQEIVPRYERADCPINISSYVSVECGVLTTLEDYDNPNGKTIRTSLIIIHSQGLRCIPIPSANLSMAFKVSFNI